MNEWQAAALLFHPNDDLSAVPWTE